MRAAMSKIALAVFLAACLVLVILATAGHAQEVPQCPDNVPAQGCYTLGGGETITVTRDNQYPPSAPEGPVIVPVVAQPTFTG